MKVSFLKNYFNVTKINENKLKRLISHLRPKSLEVCTDQIDSALQLKKSQIQL